MNCHLRKQVSLDLASTHCTILLSNNLRLSTFIHLFLLVYRPSNCLHMSSLVLSFFLSHRDNFLANCLNNFHINCKTASLGPKNSYLAIILHIYFHPSTAKLLFHVFYQPPIHHYKLIHF